MSKNITVRDTTAIAKGSLADIAVKENISIAEAFAGANLIIILDVSGSMMANDAPTEYGHTTRHDAAEQQVRNLQKKYEGKVALFCFSDSVMFVPDGVPVRMNGGTEMDKALTYMKRADGIGLEIVLISDGMPTDGEENVLRTARTYGQKIDCIYIGPQDDMGERFLRELASVTGGKYVKTEEVAIFEESVEQLLLTA